MQREQEPPRPPVFITLICPNGCEVFVEATIVAVQQGVACEHCGVTLVTRVTPTA